MYLYRFLKFLLMPIMRLILPFKVYEKGRVIKEGGGLIICNHYRKVDIFYVASLDKKPIHFIAKAELMKNPIAKALFTRLGTIPVNRDSTDVGALMKGLRYLKDGRKLSLFPEGTRNKSNQVMLELKGGAGLFAVKSQKPIQPVMQYGRAKYFRKNYLLVGEPFELSDYYGKRLTAKDFDDMNDIMRKKMLELRQELIEKMRADGKLKK